MKKPIDLWIGFFFMISMFMIYVEWLHPKVMQITMNFLGI